MEDLIEINEKNFPVKLDLRYATINNVCQKKLYKNPICYLHKDAAQKLEKAINLAEKYHLKFKIFDGYRPIKIQQEMFDQFYNGDENFDFISNPKTGSIPHCRGVAIDLTLIDKNNNEIEMGSDFDEFSELAFHNCQTITTIAKNNRILLLEIMTKAGWDFYRKEWWHYQLFNARNYKVIQNFEI